MPDVLSTLFTVTGHVQVISATNAVAKAMTNLATVQKAGNIQDWQSQKSSTAVVDAARQVRLAKLAEAQAVAMSARTQVIAIAMIVGAYTVATEKLVKFNSEVMNIQSLTGASAKDSVRAENMFRIAGVPDSQAMRDIIRLGKDAFSAQGQGALAQLGVGGGGQNGLQLFDQIADRLHGMQDGLRKTQIEEQLFGVRGVAAIQPLLRLTRQQRNEINALPDSFDTQMMPSVQAFQAEMSIAGQTILQDFIFPLARSAMPVILTITQTVGGMAEGFNAVNNALGGIPGAIVVFGSMFLILAKIVSVVMTLSNAMKLYRAAIIGVAIAQEVLNWVSGNWVVAAVGASALAAVGIGGYAIYKNSGGGDEPASKNVSALEDNTAALMKLGDSFSGLRGHGVPSGLNTTDISTLYRSGRIAAVG